ncbi:GSCOCT00014112001.2-RA-CDS [Cotesia congregata]|uniref:Venom protein 22 n=1 Tax=Cotesia congregata TaxID=51543 RepID=A0A8J2HA20_COTCN|nr:GSCOCT00014112001.2-RA-CDS [Cotesia congregata]CAG5088677.1 Putative venom protein 22 [Cotesia congregata]
MFNYKLITLMLVALYCVLQVSEVFASVNSEEEWIPLNNKSPDVIAVAKDGILEYEISNNVTHKFVMLNVITSMYHWESSAVELIIIAKFKETNCPRDSNVEASSCPILEDKDSKLCWIYKIQPYHASGYVKILCY